MTLILKIFYFFFKFFLTILGDREPEVDFLRDVIYERPLNPTKIEHLAIFSTKTEHVPLFGEKSMVSLVMTCHHKSKLKMNEE